ncbi:DgyrCDS12163 [Dimorphilus gyrociliatus]|uniref:Pyrroline-5-carboxylate reductase n=1 Tax=Dimorphilus gyrociliatus TaxID=2664684 RepID=A0A7I8W5M9_9ANNE|nr:DgyrCDS12163 [Dimorphilus gyrociliatus]
MDCMDNTKKGVKVSDNSEIISNGKTETMLCNNVKEKYDIVGSKSSLLLEERKSNATFERFLQSVISKFNEETSDNTSLSQLNLKIGFIGAGKMAQAICKGFIISKLIKAENVSASSTGMNTSNVESMKNIGVRMANSNADVMHSSDIIIIAVKPHIVSTVLQEINCIEMKSKLFVSVAAGITLEKIEELLPKNTRAIRVMPNTPCLVQCGASVCSPGSSATKEDCDMIVKLMSSIGICHVAPERLLNGVTGLSGSGPAYVFQMVEAMSDGGVKQGLPRDLATKLAAQTLMGAAKMVLETGLHPGALKDAVTSPGGTTISGLHELEKGGLRAALMCAVEAAAKRASELSHS